MDLSSDKLKKRLVRKKRVRVKISGTAARPRLTVFRSNKFIYAQLIDDVKGVTLAAASSTEKELKGKLKSQKDTEAARLVGKVLAERALKGKIKEAVFDRSGYLYHGRVKSLADSARETGLKF